MTEKITNSSKRLQEMIDKLSLKQSDIVAKTGITKSALSNYLHGTREPRQDQISKIADPYGINPTWLMGYDVPMFMEDNKGKDLILSDEEKEFIYAIRSLSPEAKHHFAVYMAFLKDQGKL